MTRRHAALFRSAYAAGNLTPEDVLAFHKARYAGVDLRMEDPDPADAKPDPDAKPDAKPDAADGFPANTPVADMTEGQQVAYWKHQARKHEQRSAARGDYDTIKAERDRLASANQTEADKAIAAAAEAARREGESAATSKYADLLVAAKFESALAGKRKPDDIATIVSGIDPKKFLTDSGEVDTDKVTQYAAGLAPAGNGWPDTGQGNRGTGTSGKGVAVGAEMFAAKRGKTNT